MACGLAESSRSGHFFWQRLKSGHFQAERGRGRAKRFGLSGTAAYTAASVDKSVLRGRSTAAG